MSDKEHESHGGSHGPGGHGGGGGHEEHEGAPEWLISFADNVTLMMGFFVILLAMNMGPKGGGGEGTADKNGKKAGQEENPAMLDFAIAVRAAFNNPVSPNNPGDAVLVQRLKQRQGSGSEDPGVRGENERSQSRRESDYRNLYGVVTFANNSAAISDDGKKTIEELSQKRLQGVKLVVELRGHASAAEAFEKTDRGMKISFDRALAVAQAMSDAGIDWRQLRLVPVGDNDRIRPLAYDRESHATNECVEVILTNEVLKD